MKVAFLEPLGIPQEALKAKVDEVLGDRVEAVYYNDRNENADVMVERAKGAECLVFSNIRFSKEMIDQLPELKYICVAFTGVDLVDVDYCKEKGIRVSNCSGYSNAAVADLVFGMIIALARNIIPCNDVVRKGGTKDGLVGFELEGKKFGVVGAGAIGSRVLAIAQAFGCETYAYNEPARELPGVTNAPSMNWIFENCDIVSIHVPQMPSTIGLVGKEQIGLMKKNAVLINCARGPIVDSEALADALNEGRIAGAGVDVFNTEPPIDPANVLLNAKNVVATPHVAFASDGAFVKRAAIVCKNIDAWLNGDAINVIA